VDGLPEIRDLDPVRRNVSLQPKSATGMLRVRLDPDDVIAELYELNNVLTIEN
jgi:hypothetical protein